MESEELRLLRENNYLLRQIITYLQATSQNAHAKEFLINLMANLASEGITNR